MPVDKITPNNMNDGGKNQVVQTANTLGNKGFLLPGVKSQPGLQTPKFKTPVAVQDKTPNIKDKKPATSSGACCSEVKTYNVRVEATCFMYMDDLVSTVCMTPLKG